MHVVLKPSPSINHRYRIVLPNQQSIDFGKNDASYYSDHGNPRVMRAQLLRKGAIIPKKLRIERDPYEIHREMLKIDKSEKEDWEDIFGEEYWERWVLWSYPTVEKAKLFMVMNKGILFMPTSESLWFCKDEIKNM